MGESITENVERYINYLGRIERVEKKSLYEVHQRYISREVAREYGLKEEEIVELDMDLAEPPEKREFIARRIRMNNLYNILLM